MATGLRIIALTEPEYQALKRILSNYALICDDPDAGVAEVGAVRHVKAANYHPVPSKAYEVARTDQQQNIKRIRNR